MPRVLILLAALTVAGGLVRAIAAADAPVAATRPSTDPAGTSPPASRPAPAPPAMPSAQAIAEGERLVRETFAEAFAEGPAAAATAPSTRPTSLAARKAAFARRFFVQGVMADGDLGARYALFRAARDFAAVGGDSATAMRAVGRMELHFGQSEIETRDAALAALTIAAAAAESDVAVADAARAMHQLIEGALAVGDDDFAARAAAVAGPVARRANDPMLGALLKALPAELAGLEQEAAAARDAAGKLKADPDDPAANLAAGSYLCFARGDWAAGAPLLAKGSDAELKALAARGAAAAAAGDQNTAAAAALADDWWDAADARRGRARAGVRRHAAQGYLRAIPALTGVRRLAAELRVAKVRDEALRPGLYADLYDGNNFQRLRGSRIDANIDHNWGTGSADARLNVDRFSLCWEGFLKATRPGRYVLEASADDDVVIYFEGRLVVKKLKVAGNPWRATVELTGEPQELAVLYSEDEGTALMRLAWKPLDAADADSPVAAPASAPATRPASGAVPIPPSAFWHEPVWPWGRPALVDGARAADAMPVRSPEGGPTTWLKRYDDPHLPWHAAARRCQRAGGHLAWAPRPGDAEAIDRLAAKEAAWLGASDGDAEGHWAWANGAPIDDPELMNWREGEPNGGRDENYMSLQEGRGWNDVAGWESFICQWDR